MFDFLQNPSFFDHFKRRSENTKHTFGNNEDLTLVMDSDFLLSDYVEGVGFTKFQLFL